jgi:hypothetical protein
LQDKKTVESIKVQNFNNSSLDGKNLQVNSSQENIENVPGFLLTNGYRFVLIFKMKCTRATFTKKYELPEE